MIYRMDSDEYVKLIKKESIETLIHTYYASIGSDIKTSGKLHPNVFNWSSFAPSTMTRVIADRDHELFKEIYESEIISSVDEKIAPVLYEVLKNGERLIILYSTPEKLIMYPSVFAKFLEDRYCISIYKYGENEMDRPYDVSAALKVLKKRIEKAYYRKYWSLSPYQLSKKEMRFLLDNLGIEPAGGKEEMLEQLIQLRRSMRNRLQ